MAPLNHTRQHVFRSIRHSRISLISLRLAGWATAGLLPVLLVARAAGLGVTGPSLAVVLGGAFVVTYLVAFVLLARRIALAHSTLRQIRKHQFENLEVARIPKGDELNALIWQVYRTGLALEKEIRELRKMENYRREFLGNVSHELKTPIFSIRGFAETLINGAMDDPRVNQSFLKKVLRNADRLSNLVQDLSEISRIETGELEMSMAPFDLREIIREVSESLEPIARQHEVALSVRVPEVLPPVAGDRERIRQVLINLVENAVKYNNHGGHVEIVARALSDRSEVKLSVVDDGIGIAPQHLPRITERFYRVDKSRSRMQGGTGLGLAIIKHILNAHGRQLMVESNPSRGSTFGFTLSTAPDGVLPAALGDGGPPEQRRRVETAGTAGAASR